MRLQIGSTNIEVTSCFRKRDVQRGFYLEITIPKASIGMDDLYALLNGNEGDIVVTDEAGVESTYKGFKQIGSFALENDTYKVSQVCTSEYEAQLSLAQNTIKDMQNVIDGQTVQMEVLEEASVLQTATIESMLLEAIPFIVETAIYNALTNGSNTTGETVVGE